MTTFSCFFFLCLIVVPILAQKPRSWSSKDASQHNFVMDAMTSLYSNLTQLYQENAETTYNELKCSLEKYFTLDNTTKQTTVQTLLQDDRLPEEKKTGIEINEQAPSMEPRKGRRLQDPTDCIGGSYGGMIQFRFYQCDDMPVLEDEYNERLAKGDDCHFYDDQDGACYCPYELYGDFCQYQRTWICDVERLNYPPDCKGVDSNDYLYSIGGFPACYPVEDGDTIVMKNQLSCRFKDYSKYHYEGVKSMWRYPLEEMTVPTDPFDYIVDTPNLKLTSLLINPRQEMTFVNWNKIYQSYTITTPLTAAAVAGIPYDSEITFEEPLSTDYAVVGRYYYEISLKQNYSDSYTAVLSSNYTGGYFEQVLYKEPPAVEESRSPVGPILLILAVLIVVVLVVRSIYKSRKSCNILPEEAEGQPLIFNVSGINSQLAQ